MAAYTSLRLESRKLAVSRSFQGKFKHISALSVVQRLTEVPRSFFSTTQPSLAANDDEEAVMRKRNKSGMRDHMRHLMNPNPPMPEIKFDYQQHIRYKKRLYMKFGRESGINPGMMWPTREKLQQMIEDDKEFEPDLKEMMAEVEETERRRMESITFREQQVEKNMASLDKWMTELQTRKQKKLNEIHAQQEKKERLIEEVRQYFGYRLLPKDPKFQEILEKKEKEEKKALKEAKKKERFAKDMARLANMAQAGMSATPANQGEPSPTETPAGDSSAKEK